MQAQGNIEESKKSVVSDVHLREAHPTALRAVSSKEVSVSPD
jgi:hypothetical protein